MEALNAEAARIKEEVARQQLVLSDAAGLKQLIAGSGQAFANAAATALMELGFRVVEGQHPRADLVVSDGSRISEANTKPKVVIVQTSPNFEEMSTTVCGGILRRVCKAVSDASVAIDANRRVSFVLDEMYSLGHVEGLGKALSVGREKGLVCVAAIQSMEQLNIYGKEAALLWDLFQIKIYSRLTAGAGADLAEKTIGSRDIIWSAPNKHPEKDDKRLFVMREARIPVVTATQFTRDFGVFEDDRGENYVRAIVHYAGAAHQLD